MDGAFQALPWQTCGRVLSFSLPTMRAERGRNTIDALRSYCFFPKLIEA